MIYLGLTRYGKIDQLAKEGLEYLEKIFQIEKTIPIPTREQLKEYVKYLLPNSPAEFIELISLTNIKNPRNLKRLLNSYVADGHYSYL